MKNEKDEVVDIYEGDIYKKSLRRNIINYKIKLLYNLLINHMKYLKEKVLLEKGKIYFFEKIDFYMKKFKEIEKYIINCIILIKFFFDLGDPVSLIKASQTLNYLARELLDYSPNGGILVYSINSIMKKCINLLKVRKYYKSIHIPFEIIKKYLLLISALIKYSSLLNIPRLYHKFLNHYAQIYEVALFLLSQQHINSKILLKSNLLFNTGCFLIKKNLILSAMKLFKEVINIQKGIEYNNFLYYASYYNCSILYYVIGDIKNSELYLGNTFKIIEKGYSNILNIFINPKKHLQNLQNFECKLLIFSAEFNMEKENYLKAIENLKNVIIILETIYQKERYNRYNISRKKENKDYRKTSIIINTRNKLREEKNRTSTIRRKVEKLPNQFLYEVEYYENPLEKMLFKEKIKEIVGGLFDAILFLKNEKELKLKEKVNQFNNNQSDNELDLDIKRNNSEQKIIRIKNGINRKRNKSYHKQIDNLFNFNDKLQKNKRSGTICITNENSKLKKNKEEESKNNEESNKGPFITEKKSSIIMQYFKDEYVKKIELINSNVDNNYLNYFVILLSNLSLKQIEILNNTQNIKASIEAYHNLPIFFSSLFKNSLNPTQRNIFNKLDFLSLIRSKVLADPNKKICLNNIKYTKYKTIRNFTNLRLKNYSDITNKIQKIMNLKSNKKYIYNGSHNYNSNNQKENDNNDKSINYETNIKNGEFKYKDKLNLSKFRQEIINEINLRHSLYSKDEIADMILIIKSEIFITLMNELDLKEIKELKKDKSLLIEMLINEIKRIKAEKSKEEDSLN